MPMGRLAGIHFSLSYAVFFALAILTAVVLTVAQQPGNDDLPRAAVVGASFWFSGWLVQALTHFALARLLRLRMTQVNIGLIGIETRPRPWPASGTFIVTICTIASLLLLGMLYRLVEGGFRLPELSLESSAMLTAPSIGFASPDSLWRSAAWLCWVQAVFQMYPLPRTMGRQLFAALTGLLGRQLDLATQTLILRRCFTVVALLTLTLAIVVMSSESAVQGATWPFLLLLGFLLWASARASDVAEILAGFQWSAEQQVPAGDQVVDQSDARGGDSRTVPPRGIVERLRRAARSRKNRKRIRQALEREHSEAVDAQRLDEILNRLHRDGISSLSEEDRKILNRVSENLRNQRRAESAPSD